jgi:hypothetical protein
MWWCSIVSCFRGSWTVDGARPGFVFACPMQCDVCFGATVAERFVY